MRRRPFLGPVHALWEHWLAREAAFAVVSRLAEPNLGIFRGRDAVAQRVTRAQLGALARQGAIEWMLPDTYRVVAVARSSEQMLRAAIAWAGPDAAADGRSAGEVYAMNGVSAANPEIVVKRSSHPRTAGVLVRRPSDRIALMIREHRGIRVTGPEATLVRLAALLDGEALEIACEDARRRRLTSVPALRGYLDRFGRSGRNGVTALRALLDALDPAHPSASTLEVKTRRLLVAHGITDFVREHPLAWDGRTYRFDFTFPACRTVLETNGRRWHDDVADDEHDNEKWSVPGRHGYKLVLATWDKVTRQPNDLVAELASTLAA